MAVILNGERQTINNKLVIIFDGQGALRLLEYPEKKLLIKIETLVVFSKLYNDLKRLK